MKHVLVAALLLSPAVNAATLNDFAGSVVYLYKDEVETVAIDGERHEIATRPAGSNQPFAPRTQRLSGTGFLVVSGDKLVLLTAKHVAAWLTPAAHAAIQAGDSAVPVLLSELSGWQAELKWTLAPTSDVAVLRLKPSQRIMSALRFVSTDFFEVTPPSRETTLTVLGFPLSLGITGGFSPIARETKLASGPLDVAGVGRVLILQDPSVAGFSGAPVFDAGQPRTEGSKLIVQPREPRFVGVMHATLSDNTGGKFAAVVPASVVLELINGL